MDKQIKDYLHFYLGVQYRIRYIDYQVGQHSVWVSLTAKRLAQLEDASIAEIQIQLRPLSDMTEEEIWQLFKIKHSLDRSLEDAKLLRASVDGSFLQVEYYTAKNTLSDHIYISQLSADIFHYLISIGIDIFHLISAGLAIEKTKINN